MSENTVDILKIDNEIQNSFIQDSQKINEYKSTLLCLQNFKESNQLSNKILESIENVYTNLENHIKELESKTKIHFYIIDTSELICKYKKILNTPIKMNFTGKKIKTDKEKNILISTYLDIIKKYTNDKKYIIPSPSKQKIVCENCNNSKDFQIIDNDEYLCQVCFSQQIILKYSSSYRDCDRVNLSSKYEYDRKIHFRDCINQYQGKQNTTIDEKIYKDLETQFEKHYLLDGDNNTVKEIRFRRITKEHIMLFLKELDYTKHYENVNLIHHVMTGVKPDDISYLEDKLLYDFDVLTELYDKIFKNIERKNFINTQYVLYQLLTRHKHQCKKEDFSILKTIDRKTFHDEIAKILFETLGWNHYPFY